MSRLSFHGDKKNLVGEVVRSTIELLGGVAQSALVVLGRVFPGDPVAARFA